MGMDIYGVVESKRTWGWFLRHELDIGRNYDAFRLIEELVPDDQMGFPKDSPGCQHLQSEDSDSYALNHRIDGWFAEWDFCAPLGRIYGWLTAEQIDAFDWDAHEDEIGSSWVREMRALGRSPDVRLIFGFE